MTSDPASRTSSTSEETTSTSVVMTSLAIVLGMAFAATGVAMGLVRALKKVEAQCPDGTEFPLDERDFRCFVRPHAFDGSALVVVSLLLGILIVLTGLIAHNLLSSASSPRR